MFAGQTDSDMERGQGAPAMQEGNAVFTLDGQSDLVQELTPAQAEPAQEVPENAEDRSEPEPVSEVTAVDIKAPDIEPISDSAIALVAPTESVRDAEQVEPAPEVEQERPRTVDKKSRKQNTRSAAVRKGGGTQGRKPNSTGNAAFASYSSRVRSRVFGRARSPGGSGTVVVRFTVTASGGVASASVGRGASGSLNNAALRAVRGGFPPIPPGLPRSLSFTLPIRFR